MPLLRDPVVVRNRTAYPTPEVSRIVKRYMEGNPAKPPTVVVLPRRSKSDDRLGFTPFNRKEPIKLWVEPASHYPQSGARSWREELAKSAAHEDSHFQHDGDLNCPRGTCESRAERHAQARYRRLGSARVKHRGNGLYRLKRP
jgi:hypothetical protein